MLVEVVEHEAEVGFGREVVVEADKVEEVLEVLEVDHSEIKTGDGSGGLQIRQGISEKITYIADEMANEMSNRFGAMQSVGRIYRKLAI